MLFYLEQAAFTKSRAPAGGTSAALSLRSNVVGTYGSPTNAPSLYTRTPIARELLPAGAGSFSFIQTYSRVPDCYSAPLPPGTPRGCFFIWSNRLLSKAGRLRAWVLHIQREHCALPFGRDCPGSPGSCSPQERFPHKRPVTCGHRPASPDACGRDFRCAIAPLKCGRNLRFPHKRPLPYIRTMIYKELLPA